jgi:hypothetical protein
MSSQNLHRSPNDFLKKFNINPENFKVTGLEWDQLYEIQDDYAKYREELDHSAIFIFNRMNLDCLIYKFHSMLIDLIRTSIISYNLWRG